MTAECRHYRDAFSEYVDGELHEAARLALETHLEECAECRAELAALWLTVQAVGELPTQQPRPLFAERVKAQLRAEPAAAGPGIITLLWARALPVAAMLMVVTGLVLVVHRNGAMRPTADLQLAMDRRQAKTEPAAAAAGDAESFALEESLTESADAPEEARRALSTYREDATAAPMPVMPEEDADEFYHAQRESVVGAGDEMDNLAAEGGRRKEAGALAGRGMMQRARAGGLGGRSETAAPAVAEGAPPALTWSEPDADVAGAGRRVAGLAAARPAAAREVRKMGVDTAAFGAEGWGAPRDEGAAVRVLFLAGDDVADLAARTMTVVKRRNLPAEVSFGRDGIGGTVEIQIRATPVACDALATELLTLTGTTAAEFKDGRAGLDAVGQVLADSADDAAPTGAAKAAAAVAAAEAEVEEGAVAENATELVALLVRIVRADYAVRAAARARGAGVAAEAAAKTSARTEAAESAGE